MPKRRILYNPQNINKTKRVASGGDVNEGNILRGKRKRRELDYNVGRTLRELTGLSHYSTRKTSKTERKKQNKSGGKRGRKKVKKEEEEEEAEQQQEEQEGATEHEEETYPIEESLFLQKDDLGSAFEMDVPIPTDSASTSTAINLTFETSLTPEFKLTSEPVTEASLPVPTPKKIEPRTIKTGDLSNQVKRLVQKLGGVFLDKNETRYFNNHILPPNITKWGDIEWKKNKERKASPNNVLLFKCSCKEFQFQEMEFTEIDLMAQEKDDFAFLANTTDIVIIGSSPDTIICTKIQDSCEDLLVYILEEEDKSIHKGPFRLSYVLEHCSLDEEVMNLMEDDK